MRAFIVRQNADVCKTGSVLKLRNSPHALDGTDFQRGPADLKVTRNGAIGQVFGSLKPKVSMKDVA